MFAPSDYNFDLPPELIAQEPAAERDASRLLHVAADGPHEGALGRKESRIGADANARSIESGLGLHDLLFRDIVELLPADAVIVANDTRVIPARLIGKKATGGGVELLLLEPDPETPAPEGTAAWRCLARARRPLRVGQEIFVDDATALVLLRERAEDGSVVLAVPGDVYALLDRLGRVPLPRYIHRVEDATDRDRYQTMFAKVPGAVAAPTAGFHMTPPITDRLRARGIAIATVTLHVGYGTFEPIRVDDIRHHKMHAERYAVPEETAALVASGRPIVALGTTALRALEASRGKAGSGTTNLFIYPDSKHEFLVQHLITNFHLPESTLLMLVCAFAGTDRVLAAYRHAVAARYRFFSYGDAMFVHRS